MTNPCFRNTTKSGDWVDSGGMSDPGESNKIQTTFS